MKRRIEAGKRLRAVAELVPPGSRVADVGSNHGLLARWLVASGRVPYCIATERDARALARLRGFPAGHELAAALERRAGYGLGVLRRRDRIDTVCLAGLGARSLVRLLERGRPESLGVRRLVVQPQTETGRVRRWLVSNGWRIVAERMVRESGRFYEIVAAERATPAEPSHAVLGREDLLAAGPCLASSGDPLVREFWLRQDRRLGRILIDAAGTGRERTRRDRDRARRILAALPGASGV